MLETLKATLEVLESKAVIYCLLYGPESSEVESLNNQIREVNLKILDLMTEDGYIDSRYLDDNKNVGDL